MLVRAKDWDTIELIVDSEEYEALLEILESSLGESRVEKRRTESFAYREVMERRQAVLEKMLRTLREAQPTP